MYYLLNDFSNSFSHITHKFSTSQETKKIIKSLKPQNTYAYDKISDILPKISAVYICLPLNHICKAALSSVTFSQLLTHIIYYSYFNNVVEIAFLTTGQCLS